MPQASETHKVRNVTTGSVRSIFTSRQKETVIRLTIDGNLWIYYLGIRPVLSVIGTKIKGQKAEPMFQLTVAQIESSKGLVWTLKCSAVCILLAPQSSAGIPVKMDTKQTVVVMNHL